MIVITLYFKSFLTPKNTVAPEQKIFSPELLFQILSDSCSQKEESKLRLTDLQQVKLSEKQKCLVYFLFQKNKVFLSSELVDYEKIHRSQSFFNIRWFITGCAESRNQKS